jgi:aminoglycoside 6-adenylyltransferase
LRSTMTSQHLSTEATEARIVGWCEAYDLVRAAILTSTRAVTTGRIDKFSDVDVILVLTDIAPLSEHRRWLTDFGEVLAAWRDPDALQRDPPRTCWVTQYVDGSKIDFTLWPVELLRQVGQSRELPDQLDVGYRVLVDKDGLTGELKPASLRAHVPKRPSREEFLIAIEDFLLESTYVAKHLWRDDLMPAKFSLDHVMKQGGLRRMLEWRLEIDHDWSLKPGASGKGLKKLLSPGYTARWSKHTWDRELPKTGLPSSTRSRCSAGSPLKWLTISGTSILASWTNAS